MTAKAWTVEIVTHRPQISTSSRSAEEIKKLVRARKRGSGGGREREESDSRSRYVRPTHVRVLRDRSIDRSTIASLSLCLLTNRRSNPPSIVSICKNWRETSRRRGGIDRINAIPTRSLKSRVFRTRDPLESETRGCVPRAKSSFPPPSPQG